MRGVWGRGGDGVGAAAVFGGDGARRDARGRGGDGMLADGAGWRRLFFG